MKTIYALLISCLISGIALAQAETNGEKPLKKCVGILTKDGSVIYKEDCISPLKKIVKKGIRAHLVSDDVDTSEKAMDLYNKIKEGTTVLVKEKDSSDQ